VSPAMSSQTLQQSIVEFLDSASSPFERVEYCACGGVMEQRETTVFYQGREWKIDLPVCLKCVPSTLVHAA
jgi:hypothetical protein